MITLKQIMEKKEEERKLVFKETDGKSPFPNDTIVAISKHINKLAKDLESEWESAISLVDAAFEELEVPKPSIYQKDRWNQYSELIGVAVKDLYDARGMTASWVTTI